MIEDPPIMTIRRKFPRPTQKQIDAFQNIPAGFVVDAMHGRGSLDYRIKPISSHQATFVGVAVTSDNGPADNLAAFCAIQVAQAGDVIMASTDNFEATANII